MRHASGVENTAREKVKPTVPETDAITCARSYRNVEKKKIVECFTLTLPHFLRCHLVVVSVLQVFQVSLVRRVLRPGDEVC